MYWCGLIHTLWIPGVGLTRGEGGGGIGDIFGMIPQLLIGTIILLLGIYLVNTEKKPDSDSNKNNEYQHGLNFYLGIGLIIIGSVISLNLFFGIEFITSLFDNN